jgi:plasmid replication initiation protein
MSLFVIVLQKSAKKYLSLRNVIMGKNKKSHLVLQSNKLIEARYSLTVGEQRLILAMVSMIHPDDADFFDYEITIKNFSALMGVDLKNAYREVEIISARIMSRILHIKEQDGWLRIGWISSCRYNKKKGSIALSFDPKLKPYLLRLKREFTKYNLSIAAQFQSTYSIRIYQLLKQYKNIGYREFRVVELKEILGIKTNQYPAFKDFYRRVIGQAKKEFEKKDGSGNSRCDLTFELEKIKEGRRITRLKFIIIEQKYRETPAVAPQVAEEQEGGAKLPKGAKERLIYYGISAKPADEFVRTMDEEDLQEILTYYADMLKAGKVRNTNGAYLAKLLQEGVVVRSSYEKERTSAEELRQKERELKEQQEELTRKRSEEKLRLKHLDLEQRFGDLAEEEQEALLSEFEDTLERFMLKYFYKDGVRSVVIRGPFLEFLEKKFGGEEA